MSTRAYYKVTRPLLTLARKARDAEALVQGIQASIVASELPQYKVSPNGSYGVLRVCWADDVARAAFEANAYVIPMTDLEAQILVASWGTE